MPDISYPSIGNSHFVATIFAGVDDKGLRAYKGRVNDAPIDTQATAPMEESLRQTVERLRDLEAQTMQAYVEWIRDPARRDDWQRPTEPTQYVEAA